MSINNVDYVQFAFNSGELSPELHGRPDIEGYASGYRNGVNFIPDWRGNITTRPGTKFLGNLAVENIRFSGTDYKIPLKISPVVEVNGDKTLEGNSRIDFVRSKEKKDNFKFFVHKDNLYLFFNLEAVSWTRYAEGPAYVPAFVVHNISKDLPNNLYQSLKFIGYSKVSFEVQNLNFHNPFGYTVLPEDWKIDASGNETIFTNPRLSPISVSGESLPQEYARNIPVFDRISAKRGANSSIKYAQRRFYSLNG